MNAHEVVDITPVIVPLLKGNEDRMECCRRSPYVLVADYIERQGLQVIGFLGELESTESHERKATWHEKFVPVLIGRTHAQMQNALMYLDRQKKFNWCLAWMIETGYHSDTRFFTMRVPREGSGDDLREDSITIIALAKGTPLEILVNRLDNEGFWCWVKRCCSIGLDTPTYWLKDT